MKIQQNISLKPYNTFGIDVKTKLFVEIYTYEDLQELLTSNLLKEEQYLIIGGGSNFVFVNNFNGIIVKISIPGIAVEKENTNKIWVRAQAGEVWEEFVQYCIDHNWGGMENMAMIPGCVGASPVQNVGAYGTEAKDVIESIETIEITTANKYTFTNAECKFSYRNSIFKNEFKNKYIVTSVLFCLDKEPIINTEYGSIQNELKKAGIEKPTIQDISNIVSTIRAEKLPSPKEIGSAGSFFTNPIIPEQQFLELQKQYPNIVHYSEEGGIKIAAGWLIDQCGWKGKALGQAGVHPKQALILINLGSATGKEVHELSQAIQQSVFNKFGIKLEPEANIILH